MHPYVHCGIIYSSQDMEATEVPIDRWMGKENMYTHTHTHSHISFFLDKPLAYLRNSDSSVTSHYRAWYGSKFQCCKEQYCIGT